MGGQHSGRMWLRPSAAAREGYGLTASAKTDLRSCRLGYCTFGKLPLERNPWEVAAWEFNAFGLVPNTEKISF